MDTKTVLITGVSRGIGMATANVFLDNGWEVYGTSTSGQSPIESENLTVFSLDLSDQKSIYSFTSAVVNLKKKIDVLINNAAIQLDNGEEIDINILRKTLDVNLIGLIDMTERLLPIIKDGGQVINITSKLASLSEFFGSYDPAYRISKTAVNMYTKVLSERLKGRKIAVSSLNPGWVKTDLGGERAYRKPEEAAVEIYNLANSKIETGNLWFKGQKETW